MLCGPSLAVSSPSRQAASSGWPLTPQRVVPSPSLASFIRDPPGMSAGWEQAAWSLHPISARTQMPEMCGLGPGRGRECPPHSLSLWQLWEGSGPFRAGTGRGRGCSWASSVSPQLGLPQAELHLQ